jgi:transposase
MIPIPGQARIWIAMGHTDMRRGMPGLGCLPAARICKLPQKKVDMPQSNQDSL